MGYKLSRVELPKIKQHEELDLEIVLERETRSAIHGMVKYPDGCPVEDAVVKLFEKTGECPCDMTPIAFTFTDDCGQFLFGVESCKEYVVKVFYYIPENEYVPLECEEEPLPCVPCVIKNHN